MNVPGENFLRKLVQHFALDQSLHRTCAILRIISFLRQIINGLWCSIHCDLLVGKRTYDRFKLKSDNLADIAMRQRSEHHDFIDTVDEFRSHGLTEQRQHFNLCRFGGSLERTTESLEFILDDTASNIRCHNDNRVLEIG